MTDQQHTTLVGDLPHLDRSLVVVMAVAAVALVDPPLLHLLVQLQVLEAPNDVK